MVNDDLAGDAAVVGAPGLCYAHAASTPSADGHGGGRAVLTLRSKALVPTESPLLCLQQASIAEHQLLASTEPQKCGARLFSRVARTRGHKHTKHDLAATIATR